MHARRLVSLTLVSVAVSLSVLSVAAQDGSANCPLTRRGDALPNGDYNGTIKGAVHGKKADGSMVLFVIEGTLRDVGVRGGKMIDLSGEIDYRMKITFTGNVAAGVGANLDANAHGTLDFDRHL